MDYLAYFLVFLPFFATLLIWVGAPPRATSIFAATLNIFLCGLLSLDLSASYQTVEILADPQLQLALGVDGLSMIMVILTVLVTLCAVWMSPENQGRLYYTSSLLISGGALGAFCSTDLFFFYAFHEIALIPTFLMIGIYGTDNHKANAWKITLYLVLGSMILLIGLLLLYLHAEGNSFDMRSLKERAASIPAEKQTWIALLLILGFGTLVSLFPFHSWAAPAYASAPTPTAMLHAGVLKKFGLYGLLRLGHHILPEGFAVWIPLLLVLLLGNILYIGLVTIAQKQLNKTLGYSSVMHMGYIFLGISSCSSIGEKGAILLMFAHGISIALLFALAGQLRQRTGTLDFQQLGGLGKITPFLSFTFGLAAFASIGLPGFANFAGELLVFLGAFQHYQPTEGLGRLQLTTILALWGVVLSAVYMLRAYRNIFKGELTKEWSIKELNANERTPILILLIILLFVGFYPKLLLQFIQ